MRRVELDTWGMGRCEGYYKLENRRCDREATGEVRAGDGEIYVVCEYHRSRTWTGNVARWRGASGLRTSPPAPLRSAPPAALAS